MIYENQLARILILLSTYNGEQYIAEQLDSLLCQTYQSMDIIVRDDGSTDNTLAILKDYEQKYENIKIISGQNIGCALSFWELLLYARHHEDYYDYYAFCDQDDVWQKDKLSCAVERIKQTDNDTPCLYCSNLKVTDKNLRVIGMKRKDIPETTNKAKSLVESFATGCTMVFNKPLLERATSYPVKNLHLHDLWLFHTCMFFGHIVYDPKAHILYRQHGDNEVGSKSTFMQKQRSRIRSFKTLWSQHFRETEARELLNAYSDHLSDADKKVITFVATFRQKPQFRIAWLLGTKPTPKGLRMTHTIDNMFLKARILLGVV